MIIITNELLSKAFGELRVNSDSDLYAWSVKSLAIMGKYGDDIKYLIIYDGCSDPQKYVDNWMNSTIAKTEVAEYYKELSFKGEDNMNKYETLLKKYGKLCREFEAYKEVTEDIADKGTYITNEALEELKECKKKYDTLFKEHKAYCYASEDVAVKLIETEKKYDELKNERDILIKEGCQLHEEIENEQEKYKHLMRERDGFEKENKALYKEFKDYRDFATKKYDELKNERDALVQEVYYLHNVIRTRQEQVKEKMDKIKQRDKQITELVNRRNEKDKQMTDLIKERDALKTLYTETAKERDEYEKRLEHINTMSNLDWKFEVVEETETVVSSYDTLVEFCENRTVGCAKCPNGIVCNSINKGLRPVNWNEDEIAEYNELMNMKEDK